MEPRSLTEVGALVRERRVMLNMTPGQLIERADIDAKTLQKLESGERWPQEKTRRKIEPVLKWKPGGIDTLREGGEPEEVTSAQLGRGLAGLMPDIPRTPNDAHFERAERLLRRSHKSAQQKDYLGAITGLEGVQSTVELLVGRLESAATEEEVNVVEIAPESATSPEGDEDEEVVRASGPEPPLESRRGEAADAIRERFRRSTRARHGHRGENPPSLGQ